MGKWESVRLGDVIRVTSGGTPKRDVKEYYENGTIAWAKTGDLKSRYLFQTEEKITEQGVKCSSAKVFPTGTVLVAMYGATIGACSILKVPASTNQACAALLPAKNISENYLYYYFAYNKDLLISLGVGGAQPNISGNVIKNLVLPLPPLSIQQRIADALDKAFALIEMRKAQIEKLDLLIKSQFIEMFGDPVTNPKGWETLPLAETGTFKNGINFGSNESGASLYCLGVGDFGDKMTIDNTERLSRIFLDKKPSEEHLLKDGDVVFVRSNGNKELVGRCVAVYPGNHETTFSGFCIRYRKTLDSLLVEYLLQVLKASSTRYKMIGRGVNIQNLNQQLLSQLVIPIPPILLQQEFASTTRKIVEMKRQIEESLKASESFYNSLMKKCFRGEIF